MLGVIKPILHALLSVGLNYNAEQLCVAPKFKLWRVTTHMLKVEYKQLGSVPHLGKRSQRYLPPLLGIQTRGSRFNTN